MTDLQVPSRAVVRFYNKRGTAEQWIKEGEHAAHWTRLSCHRFRANEVRLQLNWRSRALLTFETLVELMATPKRPRGLRVKATLDTGRYKIGVVVPTAMRPCDRT